MWFMVVFYGVGALYALGFYFFSDKIVRLDVFAKSADKLTVDPAAFARLLSIIISVGFLIMMLWTLLEIVLS